MIAGSSSIFLKCIWNKSCSWAALLKCWFRTDRGRGKFNRLLHLHAGKAIAFDFSHCHALITLYVRFLCSDWSKFDRWVHAEIYAASGNLLTDSWSWQSFVSSCDVSSSETQGQIKGARESLNGWKNIYGTNKSKEGREEPLETMSYQTSSKRSPPVWLLIGARKLVFFWHQSEGRTAATVWNWSGKTLSSGALLAVLYFCSFHIYFSARLDFPSSTLSAPGSPRMMMF